jgi:hypothetical protein
MAKPAMTSAELYVRLLGYVRPYWRAFAVSMLGMVIVAASELLHTKVPGGVDVAEFKRRINSMQASIDSAIAEQEKLF